MIGFKGSHFPEDVLHMQYFSVSVMQHPIVI